MSGFTLVELMVTIVLGAILMALAIPSLGGWISESRMTRSANDIVLGALMARTEALKRRVPVSLCLTTLADGSSTADGAVCVSRGVPANGDAWMVFVDENRNLRADVQADILRVVEVPPVTVKANLAPTPAADEVPYIMFGADGFRANDAGADGVAIAAIVLCDRRGNVVGAGGNSAARSVIVSPTGRSAVSRGVTEIKNIIDGQLGGASCKP
jgi:type IV fimbrial biogenesis protein FimT